jgi:hypothetical protein
VRSTSNGPSRHATRLRDRINDAQSNNAGE